MIATHSAQLMKPLAAVRTSDPVTVLFCRGLGFFIYFHWNWLILVHIHFLILAHNSSIYFYKHVPMFFAYLFNELETFFDEAVL
jgi:hypothetical protein